MKNLLLSFQLCISSLCIFGQVAESRVYNGVEFFKLNNEWHLYNESEREFVAISPDNVSIKFVEGVNESSIDDIKLLYDLQWIRTDETGSGDVTFNNSSSDI